MENISIFLRGAEALGVPKHDLFQTVDLFEKKNMTQVVDSIFAISRYGFKAGTSPNVSVLHSLASYIDKRLIMNALI